MGGHTKKYNRGLTGIGALVILLAVILIAAVAAAVLVYSQVGLQTKGIFVGRETERAISTGVEVVSILASDGAAGRDLEHFEVVLRLSPGSDDLGLVNNTLLLFNTPTTKQSLVYNESQGDTQNPAATTSDYTVEWLKTSSTYETGYLKRGDLIKIRFNHHNVGPTDTTGGVGEEIKCDLRIIPRIGTITYISFYTPKRINQYKEGLYPKEYKL
jgi:flagellin FlaB